MEKDLKSLSKTELIALLEQGQVTIEKQASELRKMQVQHHQEEAYFKAEIADLKRKLFGQSRERFEASNDQMPLPFEAPAEVKEKQQKQLTQKQKATKAKQKKPHPGRAKLPEHLPIVEIEIHPEGDLSQMVCIGKEITDELEHAPARLFIKRYIRYKYAPQSKEGSHKIAPLPERVINKGIPGVALLAYILVGKYVDHLPLHRQLEQFKREGVKIKPSTINGWVTRCAERLWILYESMRDDIKNRGYLQADETPIKVLSEEKKGSTHQGYFWVYHDPLEQLAFFEYQPTRGYVATEALLGNFQGYLQSDGYTVYEKIAKKSLVIPVACWAHVRREFKKAETNDQNRAHQALTYIQQLYAIERKAKEEDLNADQRRKRRLDQALPIIHQMTEWVVEQYVKVLPQSTIGKALAYCINRWGPLCNYLLDGSLEIDNNLTENALRPVALGRKNYLFAGSHDGAKRAALFYTFTANCKKHHVNPQEWFKYVMENILDHPVAQLQELYPQNFKETLRKK